MAVMLSVAWGPRAATAAELIRDEALILELLRHGELVLTEDIAAVMPIEKSVQQIRRVGLSKDGLLIRAAFRDKSVRVDDRDRGGERYHDAYYNELAAWVVSRQLGLNIIPTTVLRELYISRQGLKPAKTPNPGTLQLWVENASVEYDLAEEKLEFPGNPTYRRQQLKEIRLFDCLIGNVDRHQGNFLVDFNPRYAKQAGEPDAYLGKIWAIDHTKAFHRSTRLSGRHCKLKKIRTEPVSLVFMQRLRSWQPAELEQALRDAGLSEKQLDRLNLDKLERRREKLLAHLETLLQDSGLEEASFFSSGLWHEVW